MAHAADRSRFSQAAPLATALALVLALGACTTTPTPPARPDAPSPLDAAAIDAETLWQQRLEALSAIEAWRVRGKVAYRLPDDAGSASLDWQQDGDDTRLRISGPLGVGNTQVSNDGALLRVRRDGIERLYPADAAPWLAGDTLLPIPMASIKDWLRGLPDPGLETENEEREAAELLYLQQGGWQISYTGYRDVGGLNMPTRMALKAPSTEFSLKVILRQWDLTDSESKPAASE